MGRTWILALSALFLVGLAPAPQDEAAPPLAPGPEIAISPAQTPHTECVARLIKTLAATHGRLQRAMVTRSRRWGDVWRADFETDDVEPPLINRAVCWQGAVQIAMGQSLAPLPLSSASATMTSSIQPSGVQCIHTPFINPCRGDPVEVVSLCVRPGVYVYPDGRSEPAAGGDTFEVGYFNHGRAETDAQWAARCASHGGIYREGDEP
jgi:hypothetical protein